MRNGDHWHEIRAWSAELPSETNGIATAFGHFPSSIKSFYHMKASPLALGHLLSLPGLHQGQAVARHRARAIPSWLFVQQGLQGSTGTSLLLSESGLMICWLQLEGERAEGWLCIELIIVLSKHFPWEEIPEIKNVWMVVRPSSHYFMLNDLPH